MEERDRCHSHLLPLGQSRGVRERRTYGRADYGNNFVYKVQWIPAARKHYPLAAHLLCATGVETRPRENSRYRNRQERSQDENAAFQMTVTRHEGIEVADRLQLHCYAEMSLEIDQGRVR